MGKVTRAFPHISEDEIRERLRATKERSHAQKLLVLLHATVDPIPAKEIALHVGVSKDTVHVWMSKYNRFGLDALLGPGKGGRRNENMSKEQEVAFLKPFMDRAVSGQIATTGEIGRAMEDYLGRPVHHSVVNRFLKRNGWRKVKPRPRHVQAKKKVQEDFKKTSRTK